MNENLLRFALSYLERGFSVVPVHGKSALVNWREFQTQLPTKEQVEDWFFNLNPTGVAVICGKVSGIIALDIEASQGSIDELDIPKTPTVRSGGGGKHFYFKYPESGSVKSINLRQKLNIQGELKSDGAYVVLPPSAHASGGSYQWEVPLEEAEMVDVPSWLTTPQKAETSTGSDLDEWEELYGVSEGSRHTSATRIIGKLLRHIPKYNWEEIVWPLATFVNDKNVPPLPEDELRSIYDSLVFKESDRRKKEEESSNNSVEPLPADDLRLNPMSVKELLVKELPEIQWTIDQLLPEAGLAVLSAPPSHFKTWFALYFAIQVACGEMIFERFAAKKCKVLFVESDTSTELVIWRVRKLSPTDNDSSLYFLFRCGLKLDNEHMMKRFFEFIKKNDIGFVVFDSLIQFHTHDENVNKDMARVFAPLKKINDMGVSVLVLHHHRKEMGDEDNMSWRDRSQSLRGASAILSQLNSHLVVHRQSQSKAVLRQTKLWEREEMKPLEIEFVDEDDRVVVKCLGEREPEKDKKTLAKEGILGCLNDAPHTRAELTEKLEDVASRSIIANVIAEMKRQGEVILVGKIGKNKRIEQYGLPEDDPDFDDEDDATLSL